LIKFFDLKNYSHLTKVLLKLRLKIKVKTPSAGQKVISLDNKTVEVGQYYKLLDNAKLQITR
jgi:hypothetical protein